MHRIDHASRKLDLFGPGKDGFTEGSPGVEAPTTVTADALNAYQEEIANVIEGAGLTLNKADNTQLVTAIERYQYRTPVVRNVVFPAAAFSQGVARDGSKRCDWPFVPSGDSRQTRKTSDTTERAGAALHLNRLLPHGAVISSIRVMVSPGAARSGANRMAAGVTTIINRNFTPGLESAGTVVDVVSAPGDGPALTLQSIQLNLSSNNVINALAPYIVWVDSGKGDSDNDILYGAHITFADPGPTNR